jgi:hypothetical protein
MSVIYTPLFQILAGGPGSGCRGDNCGRPSTGGAKKEFKTASGATYTIFKPSKRGIPRRSSGYVRKSRFKGKFGDRDASTGKFRKTNDIAGIEGIKNRVANVYNAQWTKADVYSNHGVTLFVHRDFAKGRVVIQEVNHESLTRGGNQHTTVFKQYIFKNFGKAAGFLNQKYGIRQALPKRSATDPSELVKKYSRKRG